MQVAWHPPLAATTNDCRGCRISAFVERHPHVGCANAIFGKRKTIKKARAIRSGLIAAEREACTPDVFPGYVGPIYRIPIGSQRP